MEMGRERARPMARVTVTQFALFAVQKHTISPSVKSTLGPLAERLEETQHVYTMMVARNSPLHEPVLPSS